MTERTKSTDQLVGAYRAAGLTKVTHRYYEGARHETLNETNRDEVTKRPRGVARDENVRAPSK